MHFHPKSLLPEVRLRTVVKLLPDRAQNPPHKIHIVSTTNTTTIPAHPTLLSTIATMADNEEDQDLVDYDEEEEEQNVAAEESADAEGKETKK